jgi:hypothetical protein
MSVASGLFWEAQMDFILAQQTTNLGGGVAIGGLFLVFILIGLVASIFWIWMLIDCLTSNRPTGEKVLWFLVIFFLHLIGALIYFFVARGSRGTSSTVS